MKKRILFLSVLLCVLCLLLPRLSTDTQAAEAYSGPCGDNAYWSLDPYKGVLTISGTGAMYNYSTKNVAPWMPYVEYIKTVKMESGVTHIGAYAFSTFSNMTSIDIPDTVTTIGGYAFYKCSKLTSITLPSGLRAIGSFAFCYTDKLSGVYITDVAAWCQIEFYDYLSNPLNYARKLYLNGKLLTDLVIPEGVTSIGSYAFYNCFSLKSVSIPEGVTSIGASAFYQCSSLRIIEIPKSVKTVGSNAFVSCNSSGEVHITDMAAWCQIDFYNYISNPLYYTPYLFLNEKLVTNLVIPEGVTSISNGAFPNCRLLTEITIPGSVEKIGTEAFYNCNKLTKVHISDLGAWCQIEFGDYKANPLYYAKNLYLQDELVTELVIPEGVTSIGSYAFYNYSRLTSVTIPNSVKTVGSEAFYKCSSLTRVHISDVGAWCQIEFGSDEANPLYYAKDLSLKGELVTEVVIPEGITSVGSYAFYRYSPLTAVSFPESVTSIGNFAFYDCYGLTDVSLPESITSIGNYAFSGCSRLTSITIPDTVISIGMSPFSLTAYYDTDSNWDNNALYIGNHLIKVNRSHSGSFSVREGTINIAGSAFSNCSELTDITLPQSVKTIGRKAFCQCYKLTDIAFPHSLTFMGEYAFSMCTGLKSATIPEGVTSIGKDTFYRCSALTELTIPEGVTSIGSGAFDTCSNLTDITLPGSVKTIGSDAFSACNKLTRVHIPDIESWCQIEFDDYEATPINCGDYFYVNGTRLDLRELVIPEGVTSIGDYAFYSCYEIKSITFPESLTAIGEEAFYACSKITSLTIPETVTSIGTYAFHISGLNSVLILNPNCAIAFRHDTLGNKDSTTVFGFMGSTAEYHATLFSYRFVPVCQCIGGSENYHFETRPATCEQDGGQVFVCDICGTSTFVHTEIPATGHTYTQYLNNGKTHTAVCADCSYTMEEKHTSTEESCICGAEKGEYPLLDPDLKICHTLTLASDISLNLAVNKSLLADFDMDTVYMETELDVYYGDTVVGVKTVKLLPVEQGNYYYFTLTGLTAVNMNDRVRSVLHGTKNGQEYISPTDAYSIADYAYSQMDKATIPDALKTLCADLLRYGAKAQIFKTYRLGNPADAAMTDTQKAYLSNIKNVTFGNTNEVLEDLENPVITWVGRSLSLDSKVGLKFIFAAQDYTGDISRLTLRVSYTDSTDEEKVLLLSDPEVYDPMSGYYSFTLDSLLTTELRSVVSVQVYEGETPLSATLQYSADTYGNKKTGTLLTLCKALFAYSDSAKSYFAG